MPLSLLAIQQLATGAAVILGIIGYYFYIKGILEGKVKPHAFSWFVWGVLTAIGFFAQLAGGGGLGAWITGLTAIVCFGFAAVGLGFSSRSLIKKSDWFYFIAALLAIPPWYLTGNPVWSVIIITVIDAVAFVPTIRKAYAHPESENATTYALSSVKFGLSIIALQTLSLTTVLYPASLVLANGVFVLMIFFRRSSLKTRN